MIHELENIERGRVGCQACDASWGVDEQITCPASLSAEQERDARGGIGFDATPDPIPNFLKKGKAAYTSEIPELLDAAHNLFLSRNAEYGESYKRFGALLLALFPEGGIPPITTVEDADRLSALLDCISKLHRYAHSFSRGGHRDSARDLIVYAAMLEEATK